MFGIKFLQISFYVYGFNKCVIVAARVKFSWTWVVGVSLRLGSCVFWNLVSALNPKAKLSIYRRSRTYGLGLDLV